MKTEQLIDLLARGAGPAPRHLVETRFALAIVLGVLASFALTVGTLGLNPALAGMGWPLGVKMGYIVALLGAAAWLAGRAARPGVPLQRATAGVIGVVLVMAAVAGLAAGLSSEGSGLRALLGRSWAFCPFGIVALSVPAGLATLWAMRGLAPTQARWAGFAAGLLAGSVGALGYALHCSETSPLFVLAWYTLGMLVPAGIGAALGPRLLRW